MRKIHSLGQPPSQHPHCKQRGILLAALTNSGVCDLAAAAKWPCSHVSCIAARIKDFPAKYARRRRWAYADLLWEKLLQSLPWGHPAGRNA